MVIISSPESRLGHQGLSTPPQVWLPCCTFPGPSASPAFPPTWGGARGVARPQDLPSQPRGLLRSRKEQGAGRPASACAQERPSRLPPGAFSGPGRRGRAGRALPRSRWRPWWAWWAPSPERPREQGRHGGRGAAEVRGWGRGGRGGSGDCDGTLPGVLCERRASGGGPPAARPAGAGGGEGAGRRSHCLAVFRVGKWRQPP